MTPKKVLVAVSDQGFHWDEFADVYHVFDDVHWQIDVASPRGHPKAEPLSLRPHWWLHLVGRGTTRAREPKSRWWGRPVVEAMMRARRLDAVNPEDYDAIYLVGGLGQVSDLERNGRLNHVLEIAASQGCPVGGRKCIVESYDVLHELREERGMVFEARSPGQGRRTAWKIVESRVFHEDLHGLNRVAEFLDRKSGSLGHPARGSMLRK